MTNILFAQADAQSGGLVQTLFMIAVFVVFFYFIIFRPQQKQRKQAEAMRKSLKKGDRVTAMGIIGIIDKINEDTVIIKTAEATKLEILKFAITEVQATTTLEA